MKRILAIALTVAMLLCLTACGNNAPKQDETPTATTTSATAADTTVTTTATEGETTTSATAEDTTSSATETTTSTESKAPTTEGTKAPTTASTTRPRPTAHIPGIPTTQETVEQKSISILAVGNSFAVDAMRNHLYDMLKAAGYDNVLLGILYVGGCSLDGHYSYILSDSPVYQLQMNSSGKWVDTDSCAASRAFNQTNWDIVTIQQVSSDSGKADKYSHLQDVINLVKAKCRGAKILWHMTWAYQSDSTHSAFPDYGSNQLKMYNAIINTTRSKVANNADVKGIIPAGTAVQNLRTSSLGDTVTADGYHLQDSYGDYTAALTWYCFLTGEKADTMTYRPAAIRDHFDEIAQSVDNAIKNPYKITSCQ